VLVVTFPALCRAVDLAPLRRVSLGLGAVAAAATVATWLAARPLVVTIYGGRYADSAPVLRLLALSLPLLFVNYALTHQVLAWGGQRAYLWVTVAALAVNLAANLALVPSWGAQGAAVATLVTEVAVSSGCVVALLATAAPAAVSRGVATEAAS
jgi:O-antigen/teichoic acid export membrane protein